MTARLICCPAVLDYIAMVSATRYAPLGKLRLSHIARIRISDAAPR